jgi:uncharacterized protein (TIGR04255 family)
VGEVLFGRLADYEPWKGFQQTRLPAAEIPAAIRTGEPDFRFTPWYELSDATRKRSVRIGEHVLSYHQLAPYVGWTEFQPELDRLVDALFAKAPELKINRLGLRYINAATPDSHGLRSVSDLDLSIRIEDTDAPAALNLNFLTALPNNVECTVRIAAPPFVKGKLPAGTALVIDVDVYSTDVAQFTTAAGVKKWIEQAHVAEKEQFFRVLTRRTIDDLTEER